MKSYPYVSSNGNTVWCTLPNGEGRIHRSDGPAVEYADGGVLWAFNNVRYNFSYWCELTKISEEDIIYLKLKYGAQDE